MRRGRVNILVLLVGVGLVIPLVILLAISFGNDPHAVPSVLEDQPAPHFSLEDLDGVRHTLGDLRGTPVVVNFWSTWCGPCKFEHPHLQRAAQATSDIAFFGIIYSDEPDRAQRYLNSAGGHYPNLVDPQGRTAIDYGVAGVPETFFIDHTGRIVHKQVGPLDPATLFGLLRQLQEGA